VRIIGIDTNTFYLAISLVENGRYHGSRVLPADGPARKADHPKKVGNRNKLFENRSPRERLDIMADEFRAWLPTPTEIGAIDYAYIEEPPFINSVKTFAELTAVVMVTREVLRAYAIPVVLVNVMTWKRETLGNAKADKTEITQWAIAHAGAPDGLTEDEYDATVIAYRGAVAAGDVR
jgi:Holliday junction resolvasome RuvABC endonuclease subunit